MVAKMTWTPAFLVSLSIISHSPMTYDHHGEWPGIVAFAVLGGGAIRELCAAVDAWRRS